MRRGFTILELLVASLLLGMLTTILTMIFMQSSVSWRLGSAMVSDMDAVRDNMAEIREEADNAFAWGGQVRRIVGLWDESGNLRARACDAPDAGVETKWTAVVLNSGSQRGALAATGSSRKLWTSANLINVNAPENARSYDTYTVNVMSGGPNDDIMDWQAIWSYPDDFD